LIVIVSTIANDCLEDCLRNDL